VSPLLTVEQAQPMRQVPAQTWVLPQHPTHTLHLQSLTRKILLPENFTQVEPRQVRQHGFSSNQPHHPVGFRATYGSGRGN